MEPQYEKALARLFEAYTDLRAAKSLKVDKIESRSLYHSQQCVEKALKACLSQTMIGEIKTHQVLDMFTEKLLPTLPKELKSRFGHVDEIVWVESRWVNSRYDFYDKGGKIILPTLRFGPKAAETGIKVAELVLMASIDCVNYLFNVNLPKDYEQLKKVVEKELRGAHRSKSGKSLA